MSFVDEHELAELRRRVDAELLRPDARARGAELRLGRGGHGDPRRSHPRHLAQAGQQHRQLLGRSDPDDALHPAAAVVPLRASSSSRRAWCRRSATTTRSRCFRRPRTPTARRSSTSSSRWARRRRRSRSRSWARTAAGSSTRTRRTRSRTRRRSRTSSIIAVDPRDPRGAHLHVRQDGQGHAAGLGPARGDVRRSSCRSSGSASSREQAANPALASLPIDQVAERAPVRAATWRARRCASASRRPRSTRRRRRPPRTAASTRCTTRSRRSAASCRCGSSSSARSSSAASAPACTGC